MKFITCHGLFLVRQDLAVITVIKEANNQPMYPKSTSEAIVKGTMDHHACVTNRESNLYWYDIYFLILSIESVIHNLFSAV